MSVILLVHAPMFGPEIFDGLRGALASRGFETAAPDLGRYLGPRTSNWARHAVDRLRSTAAQPIAVIADGPGLSAALRAYERAPVPIVAIAPDREMPIPADVMDAPQDAPAMTDEQVAAGEQLAGVFEKAQQQSLTDGDYDEFSDAFVRMDSGLSPSGRDVLRASVRLRAPEILSTLDTEWERPPESDPWEQLAATYRAPLAVIRKRLAAPAYEAWLDEPIRSAPQGTVVTHEYPSGYFWIDDPTLILAQLPEAD